jgi:UDP-glucose 4,6-dehydratase
MYEPVSVLLTGGAGFIGSNVLKLFVTKYPHVKFVCLDKLDYCASLRNFDTFSTQSNFVFVKGDVTSSDLVNHIILSHQIDTILHFAAQTHVDNSFGNSVTFTNTNVIGTHVLLESAKLFQPQVRRFIHVSTDEVYGESTTAHDDVSFAEDTAMNPSNPYAATKAAAELLVKSYWQSFQLPVIITRANNVYGPHQYPEKLIPKLIELLNHDRPCTIHGDGSHLRSFLYVTDAAEAFDIVLHHAETGQVYNIGTDFEISNLDVAKRLLELYCLKQDTYIQFVADRPFNDVRYHINSNKMKQLGWEPRVTFEIGLLETIEWYREHPDHWKVAEDSVEAAGVMLSMV